jgi:hypothetical protein
VLAVGVVGGAFLLIGVPGPRPLTEPGEGASLTAEVKESVAAVWRVPAARTLVGVVGSQYILVGALDVLYVVLAITTLGMGESGAGYFNSAFGAGGLLGVVVTATLVARRRLAPALIAGILTAALALGVLGVFPSVVGAFVLITIAGLSRTVFDVTGRILLQRAAPPQVLGQVFALLESLMDAGLVCGAILVPVLVGLSGARAALVGTALLFFVLVALAFRRLRTIDDSADMPQVEIQLLRSISIFSPLPAPELEGLARALVPVEASAGTTLMTEGEPGDRFYAIADGQVRVTKGGQEVATLGRGDRCRTDGRQSVLAREGAVRARADGSRARGACRRRPRHAPSCEVRVDLMPAGRRRYGPRPGSRRGSRAPAAAPRSAAMAATKNGQRNAAATSSQSVPSSRSLSCSSTTPSTKPTLLPMLSAIGCATLRSSLMPAVALMVRAWSSALTTLSLVVWLRPVWARVRA